MASVNDYHITANIAPGAGRQIQHQRSKSNILKSFIHKRTNSDGSPLPPADLLPSSTPASDFQYTPHDHEMGNLFSRPVALGEIPQNSSRSPTKDQPSAPSSPAKKGFSSIKQPKQSSVKPKKIKSATNLIGLLSRPKSSKNLKVQSAEDEDRSKQRNKENQPPQTSQAPQAPQPITRPPIYAQFSSGAVEKQNELDHIKDQNIRRYITNNQSSSSMVSSNRSAKERPKSYHAPNLQSADMKAASGSAKASKSKIQRGFKALTGSTESQNRPLSAQSAEPVLDPKDVDEQFEAMLDRRNIPEHQRYKMRNLAGTMKMELIRQDWAESRGTTGMRPESVGSDFSYNASQVQEQEKEKVKKSRGRTFTMSRGKKSDSTSPVKKQKGEGSIGRHFRSRSTDSVASERPVSGGSSTGSGILSRVMQQGPVDFVNYLRKVQKPELVEVGKLHKLRLLLRNETVTWTEEFIRQGGMQEIVSLLHRIMEVEWREEHEDALLHENLLCLKALCTTALALQELHSHQGSLFPALIHMIFDPDKKGPSEFTTRNIITSVLFTYIQSAAPADRPVRAKTVLGHLRDPEPKEEDRPLGFVLDMRRERPYRMWCKEISNVVKEVFWIYLHRMNVVYLPREKEPKDGAGPSGMDGVTYMETYFPSERAPQPAAPYVGGVEWDATNYITSHLDLINAILACTPTAEERNNLRGLLRLCGLERSMGGSMRLAKEKLYPYLHECLRTWVAAAAEDGWDVRDVRYGPPATPATPKSPTKRQAGGGGGANNKGKSKVEEPPPKIDMPQFNFGLDSDASPSHRAAAPAGKTGVDDWLS
ncbi:armadillo-type protein [Annulohypoxylon truncatum]|uniref:armadillo-type protein n=1 Tax=Annulohypoxylon truncatum TaxID=327061 RepID=UPI002007A288|nr:armadillo-type protein [Annulohypoxylon truncatum]KAI1211304.1 armadillo-type protein [Annulohypoxylon truncatum]